MKARTPFVLLALVVVAAACGEDEPATLTGEGVVLRYAYAPGDELTYQVTQEMTMAMEASEASGALGSGLDAAMTMDLTMQIDYAVAEGPDPETVEITIATTILDGSGSVESLGQVEEIPFDQLAAQNTAEVAVVLDARGNPISVEVGGESLPTDLLGDLQGATGLGDLVAPQHMGPQFPEGPVEVGSSWTTDSESSTFGIDISTRADHEVVALEEVAGRTAYRIVSVVNTAGFEMSLADIMGALLGSGAALGDGADAAELEAAAEMLDAMGIDAVYRIADSTVEMTSWFDAAEGVVVRVESTMPMMMDVEMTGMPDVGDLAVTMDMEIIQTMELAE